MAEAEPPGAAARPASARRGGGRTSLIVRRAGGSMQSPLSRILARRKVLEELPPFTQLRTAARPAGPGRWGTAGQQIWALGGLATGL